MAIPKQRGSRRSTPIPVRYRIKAVAAAIQLAAVQLQLGRPLFNTP